MTVWLVWTAPILLAIAVAARRASPGPWIDRLFHFFGIGAIDSRRALICALVIIAVIGWGTDAILASATALESPWRQLDGLAIGALSALSVLMLAGWLNPSPDGHAHGEARAQPPSETWPHVAKSDDGGSTPGEER